MFPHNSIDKQNSHLFDEKINKPPFLHFFQADGYSFVLDFHTNRLFSLKPKEAEVIEKWKRGAKLSELSKDYPGEITEIKSLQKQGLFCCDPPHSLAFGIDWERLCEKILYERSRTLIEITEKCNLRCKYCTFHGGFSDHRIHKSRTISEDLLKKSISSALKHGERLNEISIGFYGGEPLCAFKLLKSAVNYAQEKSRGKKLRFSITTNATLLDNEKACFLRDAGFSVLVSIDGPQYMHNHYRVFSDGRGSYTETIKGMKTLLDVYSPDQHDKIGLNMVVPSAEWIKFLEDLWNDEPWIPKTLSAQATVVDPPAGLFLPPPPSGTSSNKRKGKWLSCIKEGKIEKKYLGIDNINKSMAKLHLRPIFPGYRQTFFPNGCCLPGVRKIYVQVDGTYRVCESAHGVPPIGSIEKGVGLPQIKRIIDEYCQMSFQDCKDCWAISICTLCFSSAYESGKFNINKKRKNCYNTKNILKQNLKLYGLISQKYPQKLDEWDKVEII
jgi:uncharacterized protein